MARKPTDDNQLKFMLPHRNSLRPDTCKLSADQIAWLNDPFNADGETPKDFETFRKRYREWVIDTLPADWRDEYTSEGYRLCHIIAAKHGGPNCMNNVFMFWAAVTRCIGARADCLNCALVGPDNTQRAVAAAKLASTSVRSVYKYNGEAVKMAVYRGQHWWKEYYNALTRPNGGFDSLIVANPTTVVSGGRSSKLPTLMISEYGAIKRECRGIFRFRHGRKEGTPKHTKSFGYAYMLANSALQRSVDITEESYLTPPSKQSKLLSSALDRNRDSDTIDIEHVSIVVDERHDDDGEINHSGSQSCESPSSIPGICMERPSEIRDRFISPKSSVSTAMPMDQHKERGDLRMTEMY